MQSDPLQVQQRSQNSRRPRHGSTSAVPRSSAGQHHFAGSAMNPSPPIVFLVRQQAKSVVAIHELEDRVKTLENVQEGVFHAVHDLQDQRTLTTPVYSDRVTPLYQRAKVPHKIAKSTFEHISPIARYAEMSVNVNGTKKKDDFGKGDENKQDSGVDSDCQNPMSLNTTIPLPRHHKTPTTQASYPAEGASAPPAEEDELSIVLDEIAHRGATLRRRLSLYETHFAKMMPAGAGPVNQEVPMEDTASLVHRCRLLEDKLHEFIAENDFLGNRTLEMQAQIEKLQFDKSLLEERMETVLKDRQQLEKTLLTFQNKIFRPNSEKKSLEGSPRTLRKKPPTEEAKLRVQSALKEREPLELQKQLMAMIVENEALSSKSQVAERMHQNAVKEAQKTEGKLKDRIRQLMLDKQQVSELAEHRRKEGESYRLQFSLARSKMEKMEMLLSRYRPRATPSVAFDLTRNTTHQPLSITDYPKYTLPRTQACQSLPLIVTRDSETSHYLHEIQPLEDTSGYLNITNDPGDLAEIEEEEEYQPVLSSTPITQRFKKDTSQSSKPLMDVWATPTETAEKQTSTSMLNKSELDSICSEFDPLSSLSISTDVGDKHQSRYVDSLDHNSSLLGTKDNDDVFGIHTPLPKTKRTVSEPRVAYSKFTEHGKRSSSTTANLVIFKENEEELL